MIGLDLCSTNNGDREKNDKENESDEAKSGKNPDIQDSRKG
jgi:hypothetical protein